MKNKRRLIDKCGASEANGLFENLRIKVDSRSRFYSCKFINCTFVGRAKVKASFDSCINL